MSVALATWTGEPLASSSIFTVPEGTAPEPVTVTVRVVKAVVSCELAVLVGQFCVLDCADRVVDVVAGPVAPTAGASASAMPNPAIDSSRRPRRFNPLTYTCSNRKSSRMAEKPVLFAFT